MRVKIEPMPARAEVKDAGTALPLSEEEVQTLDPQNWENFRSQAHRMLDDILDYTRNIRQRPVWQPIPEQVRQRFRGAVPTGNTSLS